MQTDPIKRHEQMEERIHFAFEVGIILKGLNALLEIVLGVVLLFTMRISDLLIALVENELIEDPSDFFAQHFDRITHYLSPEFQLFGALYLLSHGIVKAALVWGLLRKRLWAYPASMWVLVLFVVYQVIKYMQNHSIILLALTIFDLIVLWLIWHEYRTMKGRLQAT